MKHKDGSFVVLFRNDRKDEVFLVYRSDWPIWNLTGGGIELDEDPKKTAIREAFEETGFKIKIVKKLGIYEMVNPKTKEIELTSHLFEGRVISGKFKPEFPSCKGRWFKVNKLPLDITFMTKKRIKDSLKYTGKEYHEKVIASHTYGNWHLLLTHPLAAVKFLLR